MTERAALIRTARSGARHSLAVALGCKTGAGSQCVCCGDSPFDAAGPWRKTLGIGFSDWDCFESPAAETLCIGCARLLGGRPGDDPPPPRTRTLAVLDGNLVLPMADQVWAWMRSPPDGLAVLSWAVSKQKHHLLYAEHCTPLRLRIGSDAAVIEIIPERDCDLMDAVVTLRGGDHKGHAWFTRDEILSGHYSPTKIGRAAQRWADAEATVAPRRGDGALQVIVAHAPVLPLTTTEVPMIDPLDELCARLLYDLSRSSAERTRDGLVFWQSLFLRRVQRHMARPLPAFASRMMTDLTVEPHSLGAQAVIAHIRAFDDEAAAALMARLRERTQMLVALAYDLNRSAAAKRKADPIPDQELSL